MVRVKHRYLVVQILYPSPTPATSSLPATLQIHAPTPDAFHAGALIRLVRDTIADLYGDYGSGMVSSSLKVNYFSPSTSTFILRCPRDHYALVWSALTFTTRLPRPVDSAVVFRVVRVSGTIRKAEDEVIRRARALVKRVKAGDGEVEAVVRGVGRAVEKRRREGEVLVRVDDGEESEGE